MHIMYVEILGDQHGQFAPLEGESFETNVTPP